MAADDLKKTIPAFSAAILEPLKHLEDLSAKERHRIRTDVLGQALNAYFFGGRRFIFFSPFITNPHWIDEDTGRPVMLIGPEPAALGYKTKLEAQDGIMALIKSWGYEDTMVGYMGRVETVEKINENEYEARLDDAMRLSITARFGAKASAETVRARVIGAPLARVNLACSPIFNALNQPVEHGVKRVKLPITLPDGTASDFALRVSRGSVVEDLTRHYFGERAFDKVVPFSMSGTMSPRGNSYTLIVCVDPRELGMRPGQDIAGELKKTAIELGHSEMALKMDVAQARSYTLREIEALERDSTVGHMRFRPARPS